MTINVMFYVREIDWDESRTTDTYLFLYVDLWSEDHFCTLLCRCRSLSAVVVYDR